MTHSRDKTTFNREKIIRLLIIAIIVLSAIFVFIMRTGDNNIKLDKSDIKSEEQISEKTGDDQGTETSSDVVICDVSGAVKTPKVVELKKGSRISDAIDAAGGLTKTADISNINRAAIVNDGDKILIPEEGKPQTDTQVNSGQTIRSSNTDNSHTESGLTSGKISINNADSTQLQTINGVGPVTADKIIAFREQNGGFTKIEQLKEISGIGDKTFEKMKDQVSL